MKKFLALVMALCMVCMTVAVASAANSSPAVSVTGANGSIAVTQPDAGENIGLSGDKVTAVGFSAAQSGELTLVMPAVMSNATLSVYCAIPTNAPMAIFAGQGLKWVAATNVSLNGTTLTFTAPAGTRAVAVVENAGGSSAGTTAGASGADVTAPKTNDVPVELILGLGVVMFAGVAVACKRRAA